MAEIQAIQRQLKNNQTVVIRTALESDAAELLGCMKRIFEDGEGVILLPEEFKRTEEKQREWMRELRMNPQSLHLVALLDGRIVGSLDFKTPQGKRFAHTGDFAMTLVPEVRGLGLGAILLAALIQWAESIPKIEKINLLVLASNARAIALYRKFGFIEEGRKRREVMLRVGHYDDNVLMARFLGA